MIMKSRIAVIGTGIFLMAIFTGCASPSIAINEISGFTHETSVKVPYDPMKDASAGLHVYDDGRAVLFKMNETFHGNVNPEKEYSPELFGVNQGGSTFKNTWGTFTNLLFERDGKYVLATDDTEYVTTISLEDPGSSVIWNKNLAMLLRAVWDTCLIDDVITYEVGLSSQLGVERWLSVRDVETGQEVLVDLKENYNNVDTIDVDGDRILVKAIKEGLESPDFFVLGTDGEIRNRITPDSCADFNKCDACFVEDGFVVYVPQGAQRSTLTKYNGSGSPVWAHLWPFIGTPELRVHPGEDIEIVTLTLRGEDTERYLEYSDTRDGTILYSKTLHSDLFIKLTDMPGRYYLYPQWSYYPEEDPSTGKIMLYGHDEPFGSIDIEDGIYYFETSPDGRFFSVVTKNTLSIFSYKDRNTGQ
ncbi:MAG: hypothetical protein JW712_08120 [Dehalococcoidales bacterium]|nr:hypothetical protein [Dehalococcoidales bacterium]